MEGIYGVQLMIVLYLGVSVGWGCCRGNDDANVSSVYIVTLNQAITSHYNGELMVKYDRKVNRLDKPLARYSLWFFSLLILSYL